MCYRRPTGTDGGAGGEGNKAHREADEAEGANGQTCAIRNGNIFSGIGAPTPGTESSRPKNKMGGGFLSLSIAVATYGLPPAVRWPPRIRSASGSNACTNREAARQLRSRAG